MQARPGSPRLPGGGVLPLPVAHGRSAIPRYELASSVPTHPSARSQCPARRLLAATAGRPGPQARRSRPGRGRRRGARRPARVPGSRRTAPRGSSDAGTPGRCRLSASTPAAQASSTAGIRSTTLRPRTVARSGTAKVHAEQRCRSQYLTHPPGNEPEAVRYRRRQGSRAWDRSPAPRPLRSVMVRSRNAGRAPRPAQVKIERVACGAVGELQQVFVGLATGLAQPPDRPRLPLGSLLELETGRSTDHVPGPPA